MTKIRPDQNKYGFSIPTNKYGYTEEEWGGYTPEVKSMLTRYHNKGITRLHIWETIQNNPDHFLNNIESRLRGYSRDDEDDFSSEYWENHPRNCENFVVPDCKCNKCRAERDDPYYHDRRD